MNTEQSSEIARNGLEKEAPTVSIIIPTYKSERTLPFVLESLAKQNYRGFEAIIVNRGSTSELERICSPYDFCSIYKLDSERTRAVNYGVSLSKGDFVYYIGSDYLIQPNLLHLAVGAIQAQNADALVIPNVIDESQGYWARVRNLEKRAFEGDDTLEACRFFRRSVFLRLGGYDVNLVAYEEHDLHSRLASAGYKIARLDGPGEVIIGEPENLAGYVRKFYYYGTTFGEYIKKHPDESAKRLSPFRILSAKNRKVLLTDPSLTVGFMVFQLYRYLGATLGVIDSKLSDSSPIRN
jgi:glycosyltransferase involved in cell wall biosynthesis